MASKLYIVLHSDKTKEVTRDGKEEVSSRICAANANVYVTTTVNRRGMIWVVIRRVDNGETITEYTWIPPKE